ncbi:MAG: Asp-tRNA(Asn)/Glu-tRNA(Gln) amidotransferase subunit GatC [Desulfobacca sp.]|uniref:Asp-tRNA(Asn)/Glu-tRNA(Gln) amidotransferase subunit GatC n=1 Tax=Desulfobacca sp. TaxID=2067990 RepID=UPI00404A31DA
MSLTPEIVMQIAQLARLHLSAAEVEMFTRQLNDVLLYVAKLNELDTTDVPPMAHVLELTNAFRADLVAAGLTPDAALANAPQQQRQAFVVPKII